MGRPRKKTRRGFGSTPLLPSGRYRARYNYEGNWHNAPGTFASKTDAEGWLASERRLIDLGQWTPPKVRLEQARRDKAADQLTVGKWVEQWLERKRDLRESTRQQYARVIKNRITAVPGTSKAATLATLPLGKLDKAAVYDWWDALGKKYKTPQTNRKAYIYLRAALDDALERDLVEVNPVDVKAARHKPKTKDKELPDTDTLHRIVNAAPERHRFALMLCLFSGLRVGEAIGLRRGDLRNVGTKKQPQWVVQVRGNLQRLVDDDGHVYMHWQEPKTKAGRRDVPIFPTFNTTVRVHLDKYAPKDPADYLTTTRAGKPVMDTSLRNILGRACEAVGLETNAVTPHYGRNWFITHLAENGATPVEIGQLLGQTDLKTITEVYMKARPENIAAVMGRVGGTVESSSRAVDKEAEKNKKKRGA